jgi:hypothetical protein
MELAANSAQYRTAAGLGRIAAADGGFATTSAALTF